MQTTGCTPTIDLTQDLYSQIYVVLFAPQNTLNGFSIRCDICEAIALDTLKEEHKGRKLHVLLAQRYQNVPSPSQHELQSAYSQMDDMRSAASMEVTDQAALDATVTALVCMPHSPPMATCRQPYRVTVHAVVRS
eukprot:3264040-Pleurochrysis_carterae.AAC.5